MFVLTTIVLAFFTCCVACFYNGRYTKQVYVAMGFVLFILAALRPDGIDRDYVEYLNHFNNYDTIVMLEPTFKVISWFLHSYCASNYLVLFAIYAALGVALKLVAIRELSNVAMLSVAIYVSQFFMLHELTQIRAGVASGFLLLCIKPLYERNWQHFLCLALCATLFHYSGVVVFLLWFLDTDKRFSCYKYLIPVAILVFLMGVDVISKVSIPFISEKLEVYRNLKEYTDSVHNEINVFNSVYLVRLALCYLFLWATPTLMQYNRYYKLLLKIYILSLAVLPLFAPLPVVAYRIHELFGIVEIILIPMLVYLIRPVKMAYCVICLYGLCQLLLSLFYNKLITP